MMRLRILLFLVAMPFLTLAQAPDLDRLIANITVAAPPVESLDNAALQLHYFDSVAPNREQEEKMLVAYKALSAGFAANVHYKQGYNVFLKYLRLKEKMLGEQKAAAIQKLQLEYRDKDKADEDRVSSLQNEVSQLDLDTSGYISKRNGFKNLFAAVIVALSMLFAASLFRSGLRLKNIRLETKSNQQKISDQHQVASLGNLAGGIPGALQENKNSLTSALTEAARISDQGSLPELQKEIRKMQDLVSG